MKQVLIDTSSAILLYKAAIFEPVASVYCLRVVPAVFEELTVAGRTGADCFRQYFGKKRIACPDIAAQDVARLGPTDHLDAGERETILAFTGQRADFIIIDDRKGAQYCKDHHFPYINALICPRLLLLTGMIEPQACRKASEMLIKNGRYSKYIISYAKNCSAKALTPFLSRGK